MPDQVRRWLIAYDISSDVRRERIARRLLTYGDRVHYSVFVVDVRPATLVRLRRELQPLLKPSEDSILLCDLGPVANIDGRCFEFLGLSPTLTPHGPLVV